MPHRLGPGTSAAAIQTTTPGMARAAAVSTPWILVCGWLPRVLGSASATENVLNSNSL